MDAGFSIQGKEQIMTKKTWTVILTTLGAAIEAIKEALLRRKGI